MTQEEAKHGIQQRRRARDKILDALAQDEVDNKTILRLVLYVVEEIGEKIDAVLQDEHALRASVLNGHVETHHEHHDWIARKIAEEQIANNEKRKRLNDIAFDLLKSALYILLGAAVYGFFMGYPLTARSAEVDRVAPIVQLGWVEEVLA